MRIRATVGFVLGSVCFALLAFPGSASAARGPSTPKERAKALELVEILETDPMSPAAKEARQWLTTWLVEIPDISVTVCLDVLGPIDDLRSLPPEITLQQMFSIAAFLIRNPDAKDKSAEAYLAGVEGTIRAYESMRAAETTPEIPVFEELRRLQAEGKLEKVVTKRAKKCR